MIPRRPNRLAPLLAILAVGAILVGTGLTLIVDAPRSALLDETSGGSDASVAPIVDVAPTADVPAPLPAATTNGAATGAEPSTVAQPPTLPKAVPTDAGRPRVGPTAARAPARWARRAPGATIAAVVAATNAERAAAGCRALRVDDRLNTAAQRHSVDMANMRRMSHVGRDGSKYTDRIRAAGYPRPGAENIAFGQRTADGVVAAWMASPGHRRNILDCAYTTIGVGFDPRGNYWTQDFGF